MSPRDQHALYRTARWFLRNLELQLEDMELEAAGKTIPLFFDTSDVHDALLGLFAFYRPGSGFDHHAFGQKCTLVPVLSLAPISRTAYCGIPMRYSCSNIFPSR